MMLMLLTHLQCNVLTVTNKVWTSCPRLPCLSFTLTLPGISVLEPSSTPDILIQAAWWKWLLMREASSVLPGITWTNTSFSSLQSNLRQKWLVLAALWAVIWITHQCFSFGFNDLHGNRMSWPAVGFWKRSGVFVMPLKWWTWVWFWSKCSVAEINL